MAYNTKSIVKDVNQKPAPQLYNPTTDAYEVVQGENGATRVMVYDTAGNAVDLVELIASIVAAINTTGTTQLRAGTNPIGTIEVTGSVLPGGASTAAKQDTIIGHVDGLEESIAAIKDTAGVKKIVDPLPAGTNNIGKVDINTSPLPTGASTAVKQDELKGIVDTINNKDTTKTHYLLATDTKPATGNTKGDKCFIIPAGDVYMWDGTSWVVI